ncbi:MAG: DNA mismatch repair endonuclease MutL, partial [Nitrospiraceae bacterium]|nr:DNA mismatch repair endonuclease MutL [Nitrospiraceae bacterium]
DAGSSEIRIEALHGGMRLIRVSDNGCGMDKEDALLCFEPHATSKLATADDLFKIRTMGFRGEALPSIASVSKALLTTGLKGASSGVSLELSGGEVKEVKDAPSSGTTVEIRDLFFNTPSRRKFMKSEGTELSHIIDAVTREALSHPGIGFSLSTDRKDTLVLPRAAGLRERIMQVYGDEFLHGLMEVTASGPVDMTAFVSKPDNFRNSKSHQFIFINNRPVKDASLSHAVYRAYEGIMPPDKHPVLFLYLAMDPAKVDFNAHPTKREVRFSDKEYLYRLVSGNIRGRVKAERTDVARQFAAPVPDASLSSQPLSYDAPPGSSLQAAYSFVAENAEMAYKPSLPHLYLGDTFIAVSGKGGLTLIDHHAAHERILYEQFLKRVGIEPQRLLFPRQVKLSTREYGALLAHRDLLLEFGMEVDDFGHNTVLVRSLPGAVAEADLRGILADSAAALMEGEHPNRTLKESLAARIACHSSVRGKAVLSSESVSSLLADLEATEHPDQCPHGRPTRIFLSLDDLRKMFRRK